MADLWKRISRILGLGASLGRLGERAAARHLRRRGLKIIARNLRVGHGEIDLIATEGSTLVFVEVKARSAGARAGVSGFEKLNAQKLKALRRSCLRYLKRAPNVISSYRLDAVTVEFATSRWGRRVREIRWYQGVPGLGDGPPS